MADDNEDKENAIIRQKLAYPGTGGSNLHQKLISRLTARRRLSERSMNRRYDSWNQVDEHCRMFIDLSRSVKKGDGTTEAGQSEIPWARSIVVPLTYAILQVQMTQLMGIFTRRDPPLEIQGVGPEDVKPAKLMNAIIAYDQVQTNFILELYTAILDAKKYGIGGFHDCWYEEFGYKTERANGMTKKILEMLGLPTSQTRWAKSRQYNKVEAFDPFSTYPDPRLSLSKLQNGEFFFTTLWRGYLEILANSIENGGNYFNVDAIPKTTPRNRQLRSRNRFQSQQMNLIGSMDERDKGFHAIDSGVVSIIPSEWELGDGDRPEKWQFTWVDDTVIIRAHPTDYDHEQFNFSVIESNIDTHVFGNPGSSENLDGLQRVMNWKFNAHKENVMRHLNNRMIYDPALVEQFDVDNPDAAMHVRLTALGSEALREGRLTIDGMIHQMQLTDVTGTMLKDIAFDMDLAMRMSGAADQMMGRTTQERRTLGEITRVGHEGSARMAIDAMMIDVQGLRPLALRWCSNRQQYTEDEMYLRIAGQTAEEFGNDVKNGRILIKPGDLQGNYDYIPKTGPEPMDPGQMADVMFGGLESIMRAKEILIIPDKNGKLLDIHEMIKEGLRDKGVKNVEDFYKSMGGQPGQVAPAPNIKVLPDEDVQKMAQQGNVIPVDEGRRVA